MSQQSQFSEDSPIGWIQWFCALEDHQFMCQVDEDFIRQSSNLYGLKRQIKRYDQALHMLLRVNPPNQQQIENPKFLQVYQEATQLYGLIHKRFIMTPIGLAIMRQKYLTGKFGYCPRVMCEKQHVLPIGISQDLKIGRVKVFCPRCKDIYSPKKKFADMDGAFFGKSFAQLILMTYADLQPLFTKTQYIPKIFGFNIVKQQKSQKIYEQEEQLQKDLNDVHIENYVSHEKKKTKKKKR